MTDLATRKHGDASDGSRHLGASLPRVDGDAKVRGEAAYALDTRPAGMVHGVLVRATIGAGTVLAVDATAARHSLGVLLVLTPFDTPALGAPDSFIDGAPGEGAFEVFPTTILHWGQAVAAVIAETRQQAEAAASLLRIDYAPADVLASFDAEGAGPGVAVDDVDIDRGDATAALVEAAFRVDATYETPREYHVPIEPHGAVAEWSGERLIVREPSQWIDAMARTYAGWFGIPFENVRLVSPYVGGGFGSKVTAMTHGAVAALAARALGRPVKVVVTRAQAFTAHGGRAATRQTLGLGADAAGHLTAIVQDGESETSVFVPFVEQLNSATSVMYDVPNLRSRQRLVHVNTVTPAHMRAPGKHPSAFGLESAMDELAHLAGIDPVELRLRNEAAVNPQTGQPWSSRRLREALVEGARRFGWANRPPAPRAMRGPDGTLVGWGVAAGTFPALDHHGEAGIRVGADGSIEVLSAGIDMGTGTYTILAQAAADALGVSPQAVTVRLGDSDLPSGPLAGNSLLAGVMTGLVHKAAAAMRETIIRLALTEPGSPFVGRELNTLHITDGRIHPTLDESASIPIGSLLKAIGRDRLELVEDNFPAGIDRNERHRIMTTVSGLRLPDDGASSVLSWCAHFVEVKVDEDLGTVRVSRVVSGFDCGRLYNPKLAASQFRGGIVMGIGQALLEGGRIDPRDGRIVNDNLGDYLIPTNADIPDIEVFSVGEPDFRASPMGGKPVGEIGIVGVAPAICNAVFHATGRRIRRLPLDIAALVSRT
ncbi:xanthine dehydrogenase family protein molybdopterin-binding subunit [Aquibium carbonis]|uniref:Xanthine dehydrogenase family protein molybdopterin-binding subunit n=1 Tax=Aquibium carbonis TaxID=2495581 RepID=A0A3R9YS14_9HYPH|nr:xanthine dehydrogenase family protein molybdopterin-binding subunit [Aquibium carbonis]RST85767.1 xanthine dehydrogenase family protein molybdopterin-binding subunit [Aquibium carbonis]